MPQALKPLCLTQVGRIPFSHFQTSSLWGNNNWAPQYNDVEVGKFREQNWLNRLQLGEFECTRVRNPCVSFTFPFSHFLPLLLPSSLCSIKKMFIMGKKVDFFKTKIILTGYK